jgi:hypothetical protein
MKYTYFILFFFLSCKKESTNNTSLNETIGIFSNPNITFLDYTWGTENNGSALSNCYIDCQFSNIKDIKEAELWRSDGGPYWTITPPLNGKNRFRDQIRNEWTIPSKLYFLKFKKNDGTSFQTPLFPVPK